MGFLLISHIEPAQISNKAMLILARFIRTQKRLIGFDLALHYPMVLFNVIDVIAQHSDLKLHQLLEELIFETLGTQDFTATA